MCEGVRAGIGVWRCGSIGRRRCVKVCVRGWVCVKVWVYIGRDRCVKVCVRG